METCQYGHDTHEDEECGEPATHDGIVPGGGGRVSVCKRHMEIAEAEGCLMFVQPLEEKR